MQTVLPIKKILIPAQDIISRTQALAAQISKDYQGKNPLLVCILRGSAIFYAELVKNITCNCNLDFMSLSSYQGTESTGKIRMMLDLREDIKDRHVILVEDITDTGATARYLLDMLGTRKPASMAVCTLLDKPGNRTVELTPKYIGFEIENEFVVGFGLDCNELYRNLPYIGVYDEAK